MSCDFSLVGNHTFFGDVEVLAGAVYPFDLKSARWIYYVQIDVKFKFSKFVALSRVMYFPRLFGYWR
jgi:hypothetical protein